MNPIQLAFRVLRGDRRSQVAAIFTTLGVAVAVALVTWLAAVPGALQARAEHEAWRHPSYVENKSEAGILVNSWTDEVRGTPVLRVDVTALEPDAPVAPGIPALPEPGEVLVSPALAELIEQLPADQLADRFPGPVTGTLGTNTLLYPGELVAVVGKAEQPADELTGYYAAGLVGVPDPEPDPMLLLLSRVGLVVLVVPSLVLVASAARLTAARRERRLAALRLAGATPGQVVAATAVETALAAVVGTAVGIGIGVPMRQLTAQLPWQGGTWFASDLAPSPWLTVAVGVLTPILVVLAAVIGLRRVLTQPLGAAQQVSRKPPSAWRLLAIVGAGAVFAYGLSSAGEDGGTGVVLGALAAIALAASVVGPVLTSAIGRLFSRVWRRPSTLLAGRRLRDDPKAAYRAASGVVLAVFAGTIALTILPTMEKHIDDRDWRSWKDGVQYADASATEGAPAVEAVRAELQRRGIDASVVAAARASLVEGSPDTSGIMTGALVMTCAEAKEFTWLPIGDCEGGPGIWVAPGQDLQADDLNVLPYASGPEDDPAAVPLTGRPAVHVMTGTNDKAGGTVIIDPALIPDSVGLPVTVAVRAGADHQDLVRTLLSAALPDSTLGSLDQTRNDEQQSIDDMRRIAIIGLAIAGALGGLSAGVTVAGSVVDRRRTLAALIAAGTPAGILARALRTEAALPALVATVGAGIAGLLVGVGLLRLLDLVPQLNGWLLSPLVVGVGVAVLAAAACGPLLRRVPARAYSEE